MNNLVAHKAIIERTFFAEKTWHFVAYYQENFAAIAFFRKCFFSFCSGGVV